MHSERPYLVVCDKCRSKMSLIFHANLMHMASNVLGYFDLNACILFDLLLHDCQFTAGCINCNKEMLVHVSLNFEHNVQLTLFVVGFCTVQYRYSPQDREKRLTSLPTPPPRL